MECIPSYQLLRIFKCVGSLKAIQILSMSNHSTLDYIKLIAVRRETIPFSYICSFDGCFINIVLSSHFNMQLSISATTLTSWHLLVTFCSLHVALWLKLFEHKPFDARAVMLFGILNGTSIGLLNLSLGFNSVGFYQVCFFILLWHSVLRLCFGLLMH